MQVVLLAEFLKNFGPPSARCGQQTGTVLCYRSSARCQVHSFAFNDFTTTWDRAPHYLARRKALFARTRSIVTRVLRFSHDWPANVLTRMTTMPRVIARKKKNARKKEGAIWLPLSREWFAYRRTIKSVVSRLDLSLYVQLKTIGSDVAVWEREGGGVCDFIIISAILLCHRLWHTHKARN